MSRVSPNDAESVLFVVVVVDRCPDLIKTVGFYNRKSEYIKRTTRILADQYDSDVPNSLEALCVGRVAWTDTRPMLSALTPGIVSPCRLCPDVGRKWQKLPYELDGCDLWHIR